MANLPEPDWIALSESLRRATQAFDAEQSAVETALVAAFHDGKIRTRGRCLSYSGHDTPHPLGKVTWDRTHVTWEGNEFTTPSDQFGRKVHIISDVVVHREDLEKWINPAESSDSQHGRQEPVSTPVPKTPTKVDQTQTIDDLKNWFVNIYVPAHTDDSPNPTRDAALSAASPEFPNYCDQTHLREDLREIWRVHAPEEWKRTGPRAKIGKIISAK